MARQSLVGTEAPRPAARQSRLDTLAKLCLADALAAFGLTGPCRRLAHCLLRRALATPMQRIAQRLLTFDAIVGKQGLQRGAEYALRDLVRDAHAQGQDHVPRRGPLLPELTMMPVIVSGVLSRSALRHPLTRLRRGQRDRGWLAATLQVLMPALGDVSTELTFGSPIRVSALADGQSAKDTVRAAARRLIVARETQAATDP